MKVIGLTGGISSGKSTVAQRLADLGAVIIDGDQIAHALMEPHQPTWEDIVNHFGRDILHPDQTIDRIKLGKLVFNDPQAMKVLNQISRQRIVEHIKEDMQKTRRDHPEAVMVLDIPLLYEAHLDELVDQVWVVWINRETQIERLMERDRLSREEAEHRIESQLSLDEKAARAAIVIDNSGSIAATQALAAQYYLAMLDDEKIKY
jgi:dephospho-CoA kinase